MEGREAGGNAVISRPEEPPPEVALIERQPRRGAKRKIISGLCTDAANQHSRTTEAFSKRGDVWGDQSITGSAPRFRWTFRGEAGSQPRGGLCWSCRALGWVMLVCWKRVVFSRVERFEFRFLNPLLVTISSFTASLRNQNALNLNTAVLIDRFRNIDPLWSIIMASWQDSILIVSIFHISGCE